MSKDNTTYSVRYETKKPNGETKTTTCREVENGFIISIECYYPSSGSGDTYKDSKWETKEYISRVNPFTQEKEDIDLATLVTNYM